MPKPDVLQRQDSPGYQSLAGKCKLCAGYFCNATNVHHQLALWSPACGQVSLAVDRCIGTCACFDNAGQMVHGIRSSRGPVVRRLSKDYAALLGVEQRGCGKGRDDVCLDVRPLPVPRRRRANAQ